MNHLLLADSGVTVDKIMPASIFPLANAVDHPQVVVQELPTPRLAGLQQLRFLAALLVLVHHTLEECSINPDLPFAKWFVLLGASGVDIFFVISGFVIWRTTGGLSGGASAITFMKKRFLRVMPLYWIFLSFVVVVWGSGMAFRSIDVTPWTLAGSFLLLPVAGGHGLIMGVAWTLIYEMYFYLLCAVVLCSPHEKSRPFLLVAMLAFVPMLLEYAGATQSGEYYGNPIVMEFIFGCMIAKYSIFISRSKLIYWAVFSGIAGLVAAAWLLESDGTAGLSVQVRWWGWGFPAALLVVASVRGIELPKRAGGRVLTVLGDASYALYLTHGFVMTGLARLLKAGASQNLGITLALGTIAILLAIAVSCVVHFRIERPLTRWLGTRYIASGTSTIV